MTRNTKFSIYTKKNITKKIASIPGKTEATDREIPSLKIIFSSLTFTFKFKILDFPYMTSRFWKSFEIFVFLDVYKFKIFLIPVRPSLNLSNAHHADGPAIGMCLNRIFFFFISFNRLFFRSNLSFFITNFVYNLHT